MSTVQVTWKLSYQEANLIIGILREESERLKERAKAKGHMGESAMDGALRRQRTMELNSLMDKI